ncbi:MAG: glycerol-3-phosphate acyltransferase [Planctomycetes bacterium]|nr:glycerol-3-phosphate acyltransferase [Planctomycetota bacterium]
MPSGRFYALCLASYAAGALVTAYYLVRWRTGADLRAQGSGTLGARNAALVLGKAGAVVVALVDLAKGVGVVLSARALGLEPAHGALAAACATCGHVWPPQLGFRGGKGASLAGGALIALDPAVAGLSLVVLALASALLGDTKRGGLVGFAAYPCIAFAWRGPGAAAWGQALLSGLVLVAHRKDLVPEHRGGGTTT